MRELFTTADLATIAIDNLAQILQEAKQYLADGNDLAAWGTLITLEDAAEDLKAVVRLHRSTARRKP